MKLFYTPLFILLFFAGIFSASAQPPVLLRVLRSAQSDTLGCNFVEELTRIVYNEILTGHTNLWDSPAKELHITLPPFQAIEYST